MKNLNSELKLKILNEIRAQIPVYEKNPTFVPFQIGRIPNLSPRELASLHKIFIEMEKESKSFKTDDTNCWDKLKNSKNLRSEFVILHHLDLKGLDKYQENLESKNEVKSLNCETKKGIGRVIKEHELIYEGRADRRPFKLVSFMNLWPSGVNVGRVFDEITSGDDKRDIKLRTLSSDEKRKKIVIQDAIREFKRGGKAKGCVKFRFCKESLFMRVI